jgi:hypothetical protein
MAFRRQPWEFFADDSAFLRAPPGNFLPMIRPSYALLRGILPMIRPSYAHLRSYCSNNNNNIICFFHVLLTTAEFSTTLSSRQVISSPHHHRYTSSSCIVVCSDLQQPHKIIIASHPNISDTHFNANDDTTNSFICRFVQSHIKIYSKSVVAHAVQRGGHTRHL